MCELYFVAFQVRIFRRFLKKKGKRRDDDDHDWD